MHIYEIRILGAQGSVLLSSQEAHLSDHAAIRSGRMMAEGKAFEVWRDLDCVHRSDAYARKTHAANENAPRPKAS